MAAFGKQLDIRSPKNLKRFTLPIGTQSSMSPLLHARGIKNSSV
jgi:hypothetical protein